MISFSNLGEIDPRLISTLGCNVKEGDSPIGYFGTGLKYAIAVLLREKQQVVIWSGLQRLEFGLSPETIRGKLFQVVTMNGSKLGYTTEYGKNWSVENAYRELWCNTKDEGGSTSTDVAEPKSGWTWIEVWGSAFEAAHEARWKFILDPSRKPLLSILDLGEIYVGSSKQLFYRGIGVGPTPGGKPTRYTYNLFKTQKLTEDRTLASDWESWNTMARILGQSTDAVMLRDSLKDEQGAEEYLYFQYTEPLATFYKVCGELYQTHRSEMNKHAKATFIAKMGKPKPTWRKIELTTEEHQQLTAAVAFWEQLDFSISDYPIHLVVSIQDGERSRVLACAEDEQIWLTPECFSGEELLRVALLEEYIHLRSQVGDETREMQNVLFAELYRLGGLVHDRS